MVAGRGSNHDVPRGQQVHCGLPLIQEEVNGWASAETGPGPRVLKLVYTQPDNLLQNALLPSSADAVPL